MYAAALISLVPSLRGLESSESFKLEIVFFAGDFSLSSLALFMFDFYINEGEDSRTFDITLLSDPKSSLDSLRSWYAGSFTFIVNAHKHPKMRQDIPISTKTIPKAAAGLWYQSKSS